MFHPFSRARRRGGASRWFAVALVAAVPIGGAALVRADLPAHGIRLSADEAQRQGIALALTRRAIRGSTLVELVGSRTGAPVAARPALLAADPAGSAVAIVDDRLDPAAGVTIVKADRSLVRSSVPGVSAAFAPRSGWLALVDAAGALWRLDPADGEAVRLADGPFVGQPAFLPDGSLLLLCAPSAEAPYAAWPVRLDPDGGQPLPAPAVDDPLVLGFQALDDGGLAIVSHPAGGPVVVRRSAGSVSSFVAELPDGAVDVSVSPDGSHVAWTVADAGIWVRDTATGRTRSIGVGSAPRFSPDGASLLVERGPSTVVLGLDGELIASLGSLAAGWLACGEGCAR
jgi:hypothetical protein